jgi:hypothetical protein
MKLYVGLKENAKPVIFESEQELSKETQSQYDIIYGPFKNRKMLKNTLRRWIVGLPAAKVNSS